jgi:hypothetical protein
MDVLDVAAEIIIAVLGTIAYARPVLQAEAAIGGPYSMWRG